MFCPSYDSFLNAVMCGFFVSFNRAADMPGALHRLDDRVVESTGKRLPIWYTDVQAAYVCDICQIKIGKYARVLEEGLRGIGWTPSIDIAGLSRGKFLRNDEAKPLGWFQIGDDIPYLNFGFGYIRMDEHCFLQGRALATVQQYIDDGLEAYRERVPLPPIGFVEGEPYLVGQSPRLHMEDTCPNSKYRRVIERTPEEIEWFDAVVERLHFYYKVMFLFAKQWVSSKFRREASPEINRMLGSMTTTEYQAALSQASAERYL